MDPGGLWIDVCVTWTRLGSLLQDLIFFEICNTKHVCICKILCLYIFIYMHSAPLSRMWSRDEVLLETCFKPPTFLWIWSRFHGWFGVSTRLRFTCCLAPTLWVQVLLPYEQHGNGEGDRRSLAGVWSLGDKAGDLIDIWQIFDMFLYHWQLVFEPMVYFVAPFILAGSRYFFCSKKIFQNTGIFPSQSSDVSWCFPCEAWS